MKRECYWRVNGQKSTQLILTILRVLPQSFCDGMTDGLYLQRAAVTSHKNACFSCLNEDLERHRMVYRSVKCPSCSSHHTGGQAEILAKLHSANWKCAARANGDMWRRLSNTDRPIKILRRQVETWMSCFVVLYANFINLSEFWLNKYSTFIFCNAVQVIFVHLLFNNTRNFLMPCLSRKD